MKDMIKKFLREEEGASAVEYGLLVALIGVAIIGAVNALSGGIQGTFNTAAGSLS
jgi:pilus assembly protein Flp/PilA